MNESTWKWTTVLLVVAAISALLLLPSWSPFSAPSDDGTDFSLDVPQTFTPPDDEEVVETMGQPTLISPPESELPEFDLSLILEQEPAGAAEEDLETSIDPELLSQLTAAANHPFWQNRLDAINALGATGDSEVVPILIQRTLYDVHHSPRWRSFAVLRQVDPEGELAVPMLLAALEDLDPTVSRNAAVALAYFGRSESVLVLMQGLVDPDPLRRWEAVFSLRNQGAIESVWAVRPYLDLEPDERVRAEVAVTLGELGSGDDVPRLLNVLRNDTSPSVRGKAAQALARLGDVTLVGELLEIQGTEPDPGVQQRIGQAISGITSSP